MTSSKGPVVGVSLDFAMPGWGREPH